MKFVKLALFASGFLLCGCYVTNEEWQTAEKLCRDNGGVLLVELNQQAICNNKVSVSFGRIQE